MDESILTNATLLKYWKLVRGTTKTRLSVMDVMSLGVHVTCFDVLPKGTNGFHWTDSLIDIDLNGNQYIVFPISLVVHCLLSANRRGSTTMRLTSKLVM